jgi:uncharacterized SAM-binding protein YcdF (DUF218 family)
MTYSQPITAMILALAVLGIIRLRHRRGRVFLTCAVAGLFAVSWPPLEWAVSRLLEFRYPMQPLPSGPADAIVVLSAGIDRPYGRPYSVLDAGTYERCIFASWLYKQWRGVPVLACGGRQEDSEGEPFSATMRDSLQQAGIPGSMIWTEERSRSTYENAVYGAEILRSHGVRTIALVVEARSMPRAEACFRRQGFRVMPAPSSFDKPPLSLKDWIPDWRTIGRNEATLHELAGLAWYKFRGRI